MADSHDSDRDTFTRILVAIAVNDVEPKPARSEIDQLADEMIEWSHLRVSAHRDRRNRRMAITETGRWRSPKPAMAIAETGHADHRNR